MSLFAFFPLLMIVFYLVIIIGVLYMVYTWVNKFISLKEEHNNLLREIPNKRCTPEKKFYFHCSSKPTPLYKVSKDL